MELHTASLILRPPSQADVDDILAVHSEPRACAHNPSDALTTRAEAENLLQRWHDQWRRHGAGYFTVRGPDGRCLGFCGVKFAQLRSQRVLNLFCRLAPQHWSRGIGGEATAEVVRWARSRWPEVPLIARVRPANHVSRRLCERTGLQHAPDLDAQGEDGIDLVFVTGWSN